MKTEREMLREWLAREGLTCDMDENGGHFLGDPKKFLNHVMRLRTDDALVVFQFRENGSLANIMTQPYSL